ncbi:MAG: hypothetical protein ACLQDV_17040 [Candidatus Binataceae bacterium]
MYASYLAAVKTGKRADFDALPLGGTEPLVDPQAGLAYDLETYDPSQNSIPPFDTLTSPGLAAQMIEAYWQVRARDVPFSQYGTDATIGAAATELSGLSSFTGPHISGNVTPQSIFRGFTTGDVIGPYVSQFLHPAVHLRRDAVCRLHDHASRRFRDRPCVVAERSKRRTLADSK